MKISRIEPARTIELTETEYQVIKKLMGNISQDFALKNHLLDTVSEYKTMDKLYYGMYQFDKGE